jgi:hypothetical protein
MSDKELSQIENSPEAATRARWVASWGFVVVNDLNTSPH